MKLENRTQLTLLREQCQEKRNKETCKILVWRDLMSCRWF